MSACDDDGAVSEADYLLSDASEKETSEPAMTAGSQATESRLRPQAWRFLEVHRLGRPARCSD